MNLRRLRWLVLVVIGMAGTAPAASASPGEQACIGAPADNPVATYAETRHFVDAQAWWVPAPGQIGKNFGHAHVGACVPERETMTGSSFPLDIKLQLHDNPAKKTSTYPGLSIVVKGGSYETTIQKHNFPGWTCPAGTCLKWVRTTIPLSAFGASGLQEMRFRFFVDEPDGNRMIANMNWQLTIDNGKARKDVTRMPWLRGKGWYTHALYCETQIRTPLPDVPVASPWRPLVAMETHSEDASLPVTEHYALLDPDFHASPAVPGTPIHVGSGPLAPTTLDVAASPGLHRLHQRADCRDDATGFDSTNSGVLVVPFHVG
jgi:hypothetical protein